MDNYPYGSNKNHLEVQTIESDSTYTSTDRIPTDHNRTRQNALDFSPSAFANKQEVQLPPLELTKENFAATALKAFKFVDANGDGRLDAREVDSAFRRPLSDESKEIVESIRVMHSKFEFLAHLGPSDIVGHSSFCAITPEGLQKSQEILNGNIGTKPLNTLHRYQGKSEGAAIGTALALPGVLVGGIYGAELAGAVGVGSVLTGTLTTIGVATGIAVPIAAAMAVGYGIGYLYDKHEAKKHQAAAVSAFLKEFQK